MSSGQGQAILHVLIYRTACQHGHLLHEQRMLSSCRMTTNTWVVQLWMTAYVMCRYIEGADVTESRRSMAYATGASIRRCLFGELT